MYQVKRTNRQNNCFSDNFATFFNFHAQIWSQKTNSPGIYDARSVEFSAKIQIKIVSARQRTLAYDKNTTYFHARTTRIERTSQLCQQINYKGSSLERQVIKNHQSMKSFKVQRAQNGTFRPGDWFDNPSRV